MCGFMRWKNWCDQHRGLVFVLVTATAMDEASWTRNLLNLDPDSCFNLESSKKRDCGGKKRKEDIQK